MVPPDMEKSGENEGGEAGVVVAEGNCSAGIGAKRDGFFAK